MFAARMFNYNCIEATDDPEVERFKRFACDFEPT